MNLKEKMMEAGDVHPLILRRMMRAARPEQHEKDAEKFRNSEDNKEFHSSNKAEGLNMFGESDTFSGTMKEVSLVLGELDDKLGERFGDKFNLKERIINDIMNTIKERMIGV